MSSERHQVGLLDTSVVVAAEGARPLREEDLPRRGVTSVITLAERRAGVLAAADIETRDRRLATLERVSTVVALPIDDAVGRTWAGMRSYLAASGRRVGPNDIWIAATAATHGIPVITQDADFDPLSGVAGLTVVSV
jgi:predicted nucleic acid-binding protein